MSDGLQQSLMPIEQLRKETDSGEVGQPLKGPKIDLVYAGELKMAVLALTSHWPVVDRTARYLRRMIAETGFGAIEPFFLTSLQVEKAQLRANLHARRLETLSDRYFTEHHRPLALSI